MNKKLDPFGPETIAPQKSEPHQSKIPNATASMGCIKSRPSPFAFLCSPTPVILHQNNNMSVVTGSYTLGTNFDGFKAMAQCPSPAKVVRMDIQTNGNADAASGRATSTADWVSGVNVVCDDAASTKVAINIDGSRKTVLGPQRASGITDLVGEAGAVVTYFGYGQVAAGSSDTTPGAIWSQQKTANVSSCLLSGLSAWTGQNNKWLHAIELHFICGKTSAAINPDPTSSSTSATTTPTSNTSATSKPDSSTAAADKESSGGTSPILFVGIGAVVLFVAVAFFVKFKQLRKDGHFDKSLGAPADSSTPPPAPPAPAAVQPPAPMSTVSSVAPASTVSAAAPPPAVYFAGGAVAAAAASVPPPASPMGPMSPGFPVQQQQQVPQYPQAMPQPMLMPQSELQMHQLQPQPQPQLQPQPLQQPAYPLGMPTVAMIPTKGPEYPMKPQEPMIDDQDTMILPTSGRRQ
ncbi:hypothetical protein BC828DRAFT_378072 [Blastocladiella britannica]|nr:hypothetical protein BC828DRAFT_378072 [Blastocladiella britannica]